ncbi:CDP-alcohol phosphatidyltransferase family protein [Moheibacter sediminis]|uniref:CDP-diacylglycerol---serine O-phosphatidyltransferase n=1 Tax=Moheibacter sediminis TaxID=1434700 RepID=A0A1W2CK04_9FLAO|nr:CDP-alcohol phosphatidyltransferase family protein [Moheibacter sediminis]SMC84948.1 CDP-diacylglycerol---serine O-phosphatidyltransferase [Moheibacter sediminis]
MKLFTIPNLLTLGNLFCGCLACIIIINGTFEDKIIPILTILIIMALLFDLLDGMVARKLKLSGPIGKELDSLADVVSFGLLPSLLMFKLFGGTISLNKILYYYFDYKIIPYFEIPKSTPLFSDFLFLFSILIVLFSALRLAKFNIDEDQSYYFKGMPTPANTILIFSIYVYCINNVIGFIAPYTYYLVILTLLSSFLLISNVPLFSFKFKGFAWKDNHYKYVFLIISIILLVLFQITALPFIILLYILISIIFRKKIVHA